MRNVPILMVQDPLAAAGEVVLDCRPPVVASVDGYQWCGLVGDSGSGSVRRGWGLSSRT